MVPDFVPSTTWFGWKDAKYGGGRKDKDGMSGGKSDYFLRMHLCVTCLVYKLHILMYMAAHRHKELELVFGSWSGLGLRQ